MKRYKITGTAYHMPDGKWVLYEDVRTNGGDMDIQEIKIKKVQVEINILNLLNEFIETTGMKVNSVKLNTEFMCGTGRLGNGPPANIQNVLIDAKV